MLCRAAEPDRRKAPTAKNPAAGKMTACCCRPLFTDTDTDGGVEVVQYGRSARRASGLMEGQTNIVSCGYGDSVGKG